MPPYDCMLLFKPHVERKSLMDLVFRVSKHAYSRNGVLTGLKSFGVVPLGYGIKKLDGRYYKGLLMQMSMMVTPNFNKELHYLNKEERLLRWLLVKQRNTIYGLEYLNEYDSKSEMDELRGSSLFDDEMFDEDEDDEDDDEEEYEVNQDEDHDDKD